MSFNFELTSFVKNAHMLATRPRQSAIADPSKIDTSNGSLPSWVFSDEFSQQTLFGFHLCDVRLELADRFRMRDMIATKFLLHVD